MNIYYDSSKRPLAISRLQIEYACTGWLQLSSHIQC
jgi:hypothetical protein